MSIQKNIQYQFNHINNCIMCGSDTATQKILGKRLNASQGKNPRKKIGISTTICKCRNCGLIFSNPQPKPIDFKDHYNLTPEEYWDDKYFELNKKEATKIIQQLKNLGPVNPGMKMLDVGAGIGKFMVLFGNEKFDTYGVEPSETFYNCAISKMKISPTKLTLAHIENTDYPEAFFDFIFFGAVLEHCYNPSEAIVRSLKWLKPNGVIFIQVPSSKWLIASFLRLYYRLIGTDYVGNLSPMHNPFHYFEFSLSSFQKHAELNNYTIVHHEYEVCNTFLPRITDYIFKPIMKYTHTGMEIYVWLKKK